MMLTSSTLLGISGLNFSPNADSGHFRRMICIIILREIWINRIAAKYKGKEFLGNKIIEAVLKDILLYIKLTLGLENHGWGTETRLNFLGLQTIRNTKLSWGSGHLNVDGSTIKCKRTIGEVARNSNQEYLFASYEYIDDQPILYSEVYAIKKAIQICKAFSYYLIWI